MSVVMKLLVVGWMMESALIGLCALNQSGGLIKIHKRIGEWLESGAPAPMGAADEEG
jgi:hypothetical protein